MPVSELQQIVGRTLIGATGIADGFIDDLSKTVARAREEWKSPGELLEIVRNAIAEFEPLLAEHLSDTVLSAWINGYDHVARQFPLWLQKEFTDSIRRKPPQDPPTVNLFGMFDREPRLRLLNIENAAKRLFERKIMTKDVFEAAEDSAKTQAFTIAGGLGADTIDRFRHWLYEDLHEGTSLRSFQQRVEENLGTSPIAPSHLENVYRTNVQASFRDGRETLRQDPLVAAAFPYQEYMPIHDGRVRHEHLMLGQLGLDGTGIYRIDDPIWDYFTPPWDYNCRCGSRLMTLEQAAKAGVKEAQQWLKTGRPPLRPEFRYSQIPFSPNPGWGSRGNVGVIVMSTTKGERWITVGAETIADDGGKTGGYPVKIDADGKMLTGKFAGKTLKEAFGDKSDKQPDNAVVNLPLDKRGGGSLDSQIDRWKAEQATEKKAQAKARSKVLADAKAEAKPLFEKYGKTIAEQYSAKHGTPVKEVMKTIDSMVKWEPEKALKLLKRFAGEQNSENDSLTRQPEADKIHVSPATSAGADSSKQTSNRETKKMAKPKNEFRDGAYSITLDGGSMIVQNGTAKSNVSFGPFHEVEDIPMALRSKLPAGASNTTHAWFAGQMIRRTAAPTIAKHVSQLKDSFDAEEAARNEQLAKYVPGLEELREARDAELEYDNKFSRMMNDENNDGVRPPKRPVANASELAKKYPAAETYLKAEAYELASHHQKSAAGKKALKLLESGGSVDDAKKILDNWLDHSKVD